MAELPGLHRNTEEPDSDHLVHRIEGSTWREARVGLEMQYGVRDVLFETEEMSDAAVRSAIGRQRQNKGETLQPGRQRRFQTSCLRPPKVSFGSSQSDVAIAAGGKVGDQVNTS